MSFVQRSFVELDSFREDWKRLGLDDVDLLSLETTLVQNPQAGAVIPGLGGLRKIRFSANGKGKRGGARIIYLDVVVADYIYLIAAYSKNEKTDLSADEKKYLSKLVKAILE